MRSTYVFAFTNLLAAGPAMGQVIIHVPEPDAVADELLTQSPATPRPRRRGLWRPRRHDGEDRSGAPSSR